MNELIEEYTQTFCRQYELNDKGHQISHFLEVMDLGLEINAWLDRPYRDEMIVHFAFTHDLFAWSRKNHHEMSALFAETGHHPIHSDLTDYERVLLGAACRNHRASLKPKFIYLFDELCASADRGRPTDSLSRIRRAIEYRLHHGEAYTLSTIRDAIDHVQKKYMDISIYPQVYRDFFKEELIDDMEAIRNMGPEKVYEELKNHYEK